MSRALDTAKSQQSNSGPTPPFVAGKNKIINGDFNINQRAFTTITTTNTASTYGFDRWLIALIDGTSTYSSETFTLGTAPVAGYESKNFARVSVSGQTLSTAISFLRQAIESVRTFAGQTVTISFWAKATSGTPKVAVEVAQLFGTGGSPSTLVNTYGGQVTLSTSWARYSVTVSVPSIAGKTIGTANDDCLRITLWLSGGSDVNSRTGSLGIQTNTFDFWGVQVESGSTATAFQTATGNIQGELAACQRYYFRTQTGTGYPYMGVTVAGSSTTTYANIIHKVTMRSTPTSVDFSAIRWQAINNSGNISSASISDATPENTLLVCGTTGATTAQMNYVIGQTTSGYIGISAEL